MFANETLPIKTSKMNTATIGNKRKWWGNKYDDEANTSDIKTNTIAINLNMEVRYNTIRYNVAYMTTTITNTPSRTSIMNVLLQRPAIYEVVLWNVHVHTRCMSADSGIPTQLELFKQMLWP